MSRRRRRWLYSVAGVAALVAATVLGLRDHEPAAGVLGSADRQGGLVAAPAALPEPQPSVPAAGAGAPAQAPTAPGPCQEARAWVEAAGLPFPAGTAYRCPSTQFPHHGTACWYATPCPRGRFIAINTELMGDVTPAYFHYVVAHEVCHIIQFDATGESSEAQADACAAAHGAPPVRMRPDP